MGREGKGSVGEREREEDRRSRQTDSWAKRVGLRTETGTGTGTGDLAEDADRHALLDGPGGRTRIMR